MKSKGHAPFSFYPMLLHIYAEHSNTKKHIKMGPKALIFQRFRKTPRNISWNILSNEKDLQSPEALYTIRDSNPRHPD